MHLESLMCVLVIQFNTREWEMINMFVLYVSPMGTARVCQGLCHKKYTKTDRDQAAAC